MKSIMRFKKGSKGEFMNKKEVPVSWRTAEILTGNGHTYNVHYDYHPGLDSESLMERVSRKLVRPCPPISPSIETREVGDIVEVFADLAWKTATILKVRPGDCFTVRLLGCSAESIVHKLDIRDRLLFLDDKWILMGKGSGTCGREQVNNISTSITYQPQKGCVHLSSPDPTWWESRALGRLFFRCFKGQLRCHVSLASYVER